MRRFLEDLDEAFRLRLLPISDGPGEAV